LKTPTAVKATSIRKNSFYFNNRNATIF